ncbi:MAG TPA: ABC transporter permease [Candidatus Limnocylindrales bacterium]|nr:ABC transporter permease [Candidatus Limnocylindrales bacterium]
MAAQPTGLVRDDGALRRRHPRSGGRPRLPIRNEPLVFGIIGFILILILWEAVVDVGLAKASLLSSPSRILTAASTDFGNGSIWPHIGVSLLEWAVGFAVAIVVGIPLGLLLGVFRRLGMVVDPILSGLYATPTVALVPLIILLFGIGINAKFVVVFLEAFVTLTVSTMTGARSPDRRHLDTARSFGASKWYTFLSVTLPSSVPFIVTGLRIGAGRAIVGVIVAEFIAANVGIGFYISLNGNLLNASRVMLGVLLIGAFGVFIGVVIGRIQRYFDRWRPAIR